MGSSRKRLLGAAVALTALGVGCSDDAKAPFTTPNATMRDALSVLPLAEGTGGDVAITINDYSAAAAAMDVEPPPDDAGPGEARDWIDQLFGGRLDLRLPEFLGGPSLAMPERVESEFGWSPYDIEVSAELTPLGSDGQRFAVLRGDLEWANDADLGDGVGTIGTGDDGQGVEDERTELRPLGRPVRTGARDGLIAAAFATDEIRAWIEGDFDDAGSDARLLSAAERLDAVDAYTANLLRGDFGVDTMNGSVQDADARPEVSLDEPFDALAIGLSGEFAELTSTIVYVFPDQDAAERASSQIDERWRELDLSGLDGTFEIGTIEQRGDAVVVISRVEDGRIAGDVVDVAFAAGLFVHA